MPEAQQQDKQQKEEQISVTAKFPVSFAPNVEHFFGGGGSEEAVPSPGFSPPGQGEGLFEGADQEDIQAVLQRMGDPPPGVQLPDFKTAAPQQAPEVPSPQPSTPPPGQGGGLPSRAEAYEMARRPLPTAPTKEEFRKGVKAPSWWRMMLADFAYGGAGKGKEELERRIDRAYEESIQKTTQERSERIRQDELAEKYAPKIGEDLIDISSRLGFDEPFKVMRNQMGSYAGMMKAASEVKRLGTVNIAKYFPDKGFPDVDLPPEIANIIMPVLAQMLREGKVTNMAQFAEEHPEEARKWEEFKSRLKIKEEKAKDKDVTKQYVPSQADLERERQALVTADVDGVIESQSPEFAKYLDSVTGGGYSPENDKQDVSGYARNLQLMMHRKEGKDSPWNRSLEKRIKDEGWYFKGEYYPDDASKARRLLGKRIREKKDVTRGQANAFIQTHFGTTGKKFEVTPGPYEVPETLDPFVIQGSAPSPASYGKSGVRSGERWRADLPKEIKLGENERAESAVKEYAESQGVSFERAVEQYESEGFTIVSGR